MADSSTGGYLSPLGAPAPVPAQGDTLEDQLQTIVVGITGLSGVMVRPRWQPKPPAKPSATTDWAAVGWTERRPEAGRAAVTHHPTGEGYDEIRRHETVEVLVSFYGPGRDYYASLLETGIGVDQNHEFLYRIGMGLIEVGAIVNVPELVGEQWIRRCDLPISLRRRVERHYPVLNVLEAQGEIHSPVTDGEENTVPFAVKEST